jgi:hypothetical protein
MDKNKVDVLTTATVEPEIRYFRYGQLVPQSRWGETVVLSTTPSGDGGCSSLGILHAIGTACDAVDPGVEADPRVEAGPCVEAER